MIQEEKIQNPAQNDFSAVEIVSCIMKLFHPRSVVEIGCRDGAWLKEFQKYGVKIAGVDSSIYAESEFWKNNRGGFLAADIGKKRIKSQMKFELAVSLEVASDVEPEKSGFLIHDLCLLSDVVLFSSAIPWQDGKRFLNPQMPSYWVEIFKRNDFLALDCIRPDIWSNPKVASKYKQNMFLFVKEAALSRYPSFLSLYIHRAPSVSMHNIIHPDSWMRQIYALNKQIETLQKSRQRVLYAFYHPSALSWVIIHRLSVHARDDVYLLLSADCGDVANWNVPYRKNFLLRLMEMKLFQGIYTYRRLLGHGESFKSVEDVECAIQDGMRSDLENQWCDLKMFDKIYSNTDTDDNVGIYLSLNKREYYWFEATNDHFSSKAKEAVIKIDNSRWPAYRDTLLKHKGLLGLNSYEKLILWKTTDANRFPKKNCSVFDAEKAAKNMPDIWKTALRGAFGLEMLPKENTAMIVMPSIHWSYSIYARDELIKSRYRSAEEYMLSSLQFMCDYYAPENAFLVLKPHPHFRIDENMNKKYFPGIYVYHNLCTTLMLKILPEFYSNPRYVVQGISTANKQVGEHSTKISCPGISFFSMFYHKYWVSCQILNYLNVLYQHAGECFLGIGKPGETCSYNKEKLAIDINSIISIWFNVENVTSKKKKYVVLQVMQDDFLDIVKNNEFVIYTDVWESLSIQKLWEIEKKLHVSIIRISKKPWKCERDILIPLQNEYVFVFSWNVSYKEKLRDFSIQKVNKTLGIQMHAKTISLSEYHAISGGERGSERPIALFCAGDQYDEFLELYRKKYGDYGVKRNIACIIEHRKPKKTIRLDVNRYRNLDDLKNTQYKMCFYIVISSSWDYLKKYRPYFMDRGYTEFEDFTWYKLYQKKICMVHANCHGPVLISYLNSSNSFCSEYGIHPFTAMAVLGSDLVPDDNLLRHIDLFLYQPMKKENVFGEKFSDEYVLPRLNQDCQKVCIPNFYGLGKFVYPYQTWKLYKGKMGGEFYQDELLEEAYSNATQKDTHHIIEYIKRREIDVKKQEEICKSTFSELKRRDTYWDIKMGAYIVDNYKKIPMFNDIGHPSKWLMLSCCKKVCEYLNIVDTEDDIKEMDDDYLRKYNLGAYGIVYDHIKRYLGLEYTTNVLEVSKRMLVDDVEDKGISREVSLSGFIKELKLPTPITGVDP